MARSTVMALVNAKLKAAETKEQHIDIVEEVTGALLLAMMELSVKCGEPIRMGPIEVAGDLYVAQASAKTTLRKGQS